MKSKKIGITGGIGAGKSLVSKVFKILGVPVYNADYRAKQLMIIDDELIKDIKERFGEEAYLPGGKIDRDYLATNVFNDKEQLNALNSLVHPAVQRDFEKWCEMKNTPYILKEAALIFEAGSYRHLDKTICVTASKETRIRRILDRDEFRKQDEIYKIMENQWKEEDKTKLADFVIVNDNKQMILPQILKIHHTLSN